MKKLVFAGGALAVGLSLFVVQQKSHAADHLDAPGVTTNPLADINDVYTWMESAGAAAPTKVNLVMTVSPGDDGTRTFGPGVQYVFHVTSKANDSNGDGNLDYGVGIPAGTETKVICTFASNTSAQCWVGGNKDYITGDPTATAGITSASGKVKMFAGRRSDPFFFNLQGFRNAVASVEAASSSLTLNAAGCPNLTSTTAAALVEQLGASQVTPAPPCATGTDCFANLNVMALVLQVDKSLLNATGNDVVSVWASTHAAP